MQCPMATDFGSEKVQRHLGGISHRNKITKVTMECTTEISTDLERAPGARSIAVEFVEAPHIVIKLLRGENYNVSLSRCTFWDPESTTRAKA